VCSADLHTRFPNKVLTPLPVDTADSADHAGAAIAIAKGLAAGHTKEKPGYWVHLSGTGILIWKDAETKTYGEPPSQPAYNDLEKVSELTSLPDSAPHRDVDKIVLAAGSDAVKTAIIAPPTIYGPGRGPGNQRSIQVYALAAQGLKEGQIPVAGRGLTEWDNVHIHDLSDLYTLFLDAIVANDKSLDKELWGTNGYFLAESGTHVWGEVSKQIAEAAFDQGYIKTKELKTVHLSQVDGAGATWGLNSKGEAKRARKYLGWNPKGRTLKDEIPYIVTSEAALLGLKPAA
jgi:nucleoside-diphosphate-sugar epimerase